MKTVLLIEFDAVLARQYAAKLGQRYHVEWRQTAQQALDVLDADNHGIDLIVMDVAISGNNGVEVLHELRSYEDWLHIPVILLSSVAESRFPNEAFDRYGVVARLYKPDNPPRELFKHVNRALAQA